MVSVRDMEKTHLLDDSSDSDVELKINQDYAEAYDRWRQKEELQKLKVKYGDVSKTSSSSSSSETDEDPVVNKSFYKALSLVKSHDSKIYEANNTLLPDSEIETKKPKKKNPKPVFLKDYEMKIVLETGGHLSDCEDELPQKNLRFDEEQEQIRKSFKGFDLSEDDDDSSDILNVRSTTKGEQEKLKQDYVAYLKGEKTIAKEEQDEKKDLTFLHNYWNDPELNEKERFLRDYFLNAGYEEEDKSGEVPTYEDITNDCGAESDEEVAAEFEQKYNFRFEEPDSEFIKRYPRTIKDSIRKDDQKRKLKREEYLERKELEKKQRREEIKRLKALKRKEIEEKLNLLQETLDENIALEVADIDGDFDPEEHDRKMSELFNNQYYDVPEEEKPSFPEDEDLDFQGWDNWTGNDDDGHTSSANYGAPHCEDPDFNMDADWDDPKCAFQKEMIGASTQRNKKKKKSLFSSIVTKKKPAFDPSDKSFEQYFSEYYKLDCEDFIGDLPTRFKYREVVPNDFGLSVNEILAADDKELNHWCSLKKICQVRNKNEELYDVQAYQKKAQNELKKKKIFTTLYNETSADDDNGTEQKSKTKKQKKSKSLNESMVCLPENEVLCNTGTSNSTVQNGDEGQSFIANTDQEIRKKKQKKIRSVHNEDTPGKLTNEISHNPQVPVPVMQPDTVDLPASENCKQKHIEDAAEENNGSFGSLDAVFQNQKEKKRKHNKEKCNKSEAVPEPIMQHDIVDLSASKNCKRKHIEGAAEENNSSFGSLDTVFQNQKKKKRKHNKEKCNTFETYNPRGRETVKFSKSPHEKRKDKQKPTEEVDKRLLLSDKRLEAYGINPKKFKNKIRFSNK